MPSTKTLPITDRKIALVYEQATTPHGGAEAVLQALQQVFPEAPLYTLVADPQRAGWARPFTIRPSFWQKLPGATRLHRLLALGAPLAFESFDLDEFEIIISISSSFAKGVLTKPHQLHLCYLLTPTRYLYSHQEEYLSDHAFFSLPGISWLSRQLLKYLKWWDQVATLRPDVIAPISKLVQARCRQYYHRETAPVVYPPVAGDLVLLADTADSQLKQTLAAWPPYLVSLGRLVAYKRVDVSIRAALKTKKPLLIIGEGPEKSRLSQLKPTQTTIRKPGESIVACLERAKAATTPIVFLGAVDRPEAAAILSEMQALLMPGEEDFGITALEAGLFGKPVILSARSGVAELIQYKKHGWHLQRTGLEALMRAIQAVETQPFAAQTIRQNAHQYTTAAFQKNFTQALELAWAHHQAGKNP